MLATVETCDVRAKVLVADLLLIFLNPDRHVATCEQQLDAAKADCLARTSGLATDTWMSGTISGLVWSKLMSSNIHKNILSRSGVGHIGF